MNNYQNEKYTNNSFQNLENQTQDKLCQFSIILQKCLNLHKILLDFRDNFFIQNLPRRRKSWCASPTTLSQLPKNKNWQAKSCKPKKFLCDTKIVDFLSFPSFWVFSGHAVRTVLTAQSKLCRGAFSFFLQNNAIEERPKRLKRKRPGTKASC